LKRLIKTLSVVAVSLGLTTPAFSWSCASDEELAATVTPEERARIGAEIARQRAWAEAMACIEAGRQDCAEAPDLSQPIVLPAGG